MFSRNEAPNLSHNCEDPKLIINSQRNVYLTHICTFSSHIGSCDDNHILLLGTHRITVRDELDIRLNFKQWMTSILNLHIFISFYSKIPYNCL